MQQPIPTFEDVVKSDLSGDVLVNGKPIVGDPVTALSPADLKAKTEPKRQKAVEAGVAVINAMLEAKAEELAATNQIIVFAQHDPAGLWQTYHAAIVQAFRDVGWVVESADRDVNVKQPAYYFKESK